jgi:hypothetical protein
MDRLTLLFWLWMQFLAFNVIWALTQAAVASTLGARPVDVSLGYGPALLSWRLAGIGWAFRPLVLGSSVGFEEEPVQQDAPKHNRLHSLPMPLHAAVILLPWLVQVAIAMTLLGAEEGLHQFVSGFTQPFELSALPGRVERFIDIVRQGELLRAWGLMSAKLAAINLLPMPMFAGGSLLLLPWRGRMPVWAGLLAALCLICAIPWGGYVLYAACTAVF